MRSFGLEVGAGLQWEPHPGVVIAFAARSPGLELLTQVRQTRTAIEATVSSLDPDTLEFGPDDSEILAPGLGILSPGRFNLAFALRNELGWIALELDVQPPIEIEGLLDRRFVWNVRFGGRYIVDESVAIGAGLFTDLSEQEPIEDVGQTRIDFIGASLGVEYRTTHRLGEGEGVDTLIFSTTVGVRYAYGFGEVGGLIFNPVEGTELDRIPISATVHEIGLHLGSALYF